MADAARRPFAGVRVLDFTQVYAGPACTAMLGALGAEVVKVESSLRPDSTRRRTSSGQAPPADSNAVRPYHLLNHNKLNVTLNLQSEAGRLLARRLVCRCDLVVEAFRPGVMARWELDYEQLRQINPGLLMLSLSGNGQQGPESRYATYAAIFAALGGVSYVTGYRDGMPTEYRGSADLRVGVAAFFACAAAMYHRRRTGEGGYVDLSGREVLSTLIGDTIVDYSSNGRVAQPAGNEDRIMSPHNCFLSRDGETWLALAVGSQEEWLCFCEVCGLAELRADPCFADGFRRWKHREALEARIRAWMLTQDAAALVDGLQARGVAATLSYRMDHVVSDEHLRQRSALYRAEYEPVGAVTLPAPPWKIDGPATYYDFARAPALGEHNEHVFLDLVGLSAAEYVQFVERGAIA